MSIYKGDMSASSDTSDDNFDGKDDDFNVENYRKELDSDDSDCDIPNENVNENQEEEYDGPVLPGEHRFDKKFICVKYPGNVVNPDKAIETLGGMENISRAVNTSNRRLELRFRPHDGYCKPTCGDRFNTNGFLLRIRVKKSRIKKMEEAEANENKEYVTKSSLNDSSTSDNRNDGNIPKAHCSNSEEKDQENVVVTDLINQEKVIMTDLINQELQSYNTSYDSAGPSNKGAMSENIKDLQDLSLDANDTNLSESEKNIAPTFERNKYEDLSEDKEYELPKVKILGRVETEFRFTGLCDFQYLPMTEKKDDPKQLECIYNKIYPSSIPSYLWLEKDVPYFLPPAAFSRMDSIQQYAPKTEVNTYPDNVIGKSRKRKSGFSNFIYFSTPEVPSKPPAGIETAMKVKFIQNTQYEQIRQIFEERPIWSKNAVMYKTRFSQDRLKFLLPAVAYYFVTGPWKIMWVKLGYDPRKDPSARNYQTLDYRLKAMHGLESTVKCKRSYSEYTLPYKSTPPAKQRSSVKIAGRSEVGRSKKENTIGENVYIYRVGTIPPSRQMFYQYCDVFVDEIQEMLAKLPDPLPGTKCHEKRGWLPSGMDAQCREIINKQVRAVLRKQMNIPKDHPVSLPRKRKVNNLKKFKLRSTKKKKRNKPNKPEVVYDDLDSSAFVTENEWDDIESENDQTEK